MTFEKNIVVSGKCGTNVTWVLDDSGTLTISGSGALEYEPCWEEPWREYRDSVTSVVIEEGITNICARAFRDYKRLASVVIPSTVVSVGGMAFMNCSALKSVTIGSGEMRFGGGAFLNCRSLKSIIIPNSIREFRLRVGARSFVGCPDNLEIVSRESNGN